MPNQPTSFSIPAVVAVRALEVPNANWDDGMNLGGSNTMGLGISTAGTDQTKNLEQSKHWTLLDRDGDARTPQVSQYLGGNGLLYGQAGKGSIGIDVIENSVDGDGTGVVDGKAHLVTLADGWTSV